MNAGAALVYSARVMDAVAAHGWQRRRSKNKTAGSIRPFFIAAMTQCGTYAMFFAAKSQFARLQNASTYFARALR